MGHQAGIPTLNQGSQLDSWLGRETLAGEPEKLTENHSENKNMAHTSGHLWKNGNVPWYLEMLCGGGGPRNLGCQRGVWRLVRERTVNEQAGTITGGTGRGGTRKGHWLLVKMIMLSSYFPRWGMPPSFLGKVGRNLFYLEAGEKQNPQLNRKEPPPQNIDSNKEESFLSQTQAFQRWQRKITVVKLEPPSWV